SAGRHVSLRLPRGAGHLASTGDAPVSFARLACVRDRSPDPTPPIAANANESATSAGQRLLNASTPVREDDWPSPRPPGHNRNHPAHPWRSIGGWSTGFAPSRREPPMPRRPAFAASCTLVLLAAGPAAADLPGYVRKPEPAFAWKLQGKSGTPLGTVYDLHLVSQVWQGITWEHGLQVYVPAGVAPTATMFLYNTGGRPSA